MIIGQNLQKLLKTKSRRKVFVTFRSYLMKKFLAVKRYFMIFTVLFLNLYKIQPCSGLNGICKPRNQNVCDAIHVSWTRPGKPNFGLNDPVITEVYESGAKILW